MNFPPTGNPFTEGETEDQSDSWFKVARSILDHPIWCDCPTSWLRVWFVLLATANWAPRQRRFGTDEITVQPGQVICSVDWLRLKSKVSTKQVRDALKYLSGANSSFYIDKTVKDSTCQKRASAITIETASHGTLITIRNWERYYGTGETKGQTKQQSSGQTEGKRRANQGQTEGNASRSVEGIEGKEQSTPSVSSGKPPEETHCDPAPKDPKKQRPQNPEQEIWFGEFKELFVWKWEGEDIAKRLFRRKVKTEETWMLVRAAVVAQTSEQLSREDRFKTSPKTWLDGGYWKNKTNPRTVQRPVTSKNEEALSLFADMVREGRV